MSMKSMCHQIITQPLLSPRRACGGQAETSSGKPATIQQTYPGITFYRMSVVGGGILSEESIMWHLIMI